MQDDRVRWARIAHDTVRGRAAVSWMRTDEVWEMTVEVPRGATATLALPGHPVTTLPGGRHDPAGTCGGPAGVCRLSGA